MQDTQEFLIVREHDDSLVHRSFTDVDHAERVLAHESEHRTGTLLLFQHQLLVATALDGVVTSYRHDGDRTEVAA